MAIKAPEVFEESSFYIRPVILEEYGFSNHKNSFCKKVKNKKSSTDTQMDGFDKM